MDAVKFLQERERMCRAYNDCGGCPLEDVKCGGILETFNQVDTKSLVGAVEEWSTSHPVKTRQSMFLEQYPEASVDNWGNLMICPKLISTDYRNRYGNCIKRPCSDCRKEYWSQEVE